MNIADGSDFVKELDNKSLIEMTLSTIIREHIANASDPKLSSRLKTTINLSKLTVEDLQYLTQKEPTPNNPE